MKKIVSFFYRQFEYAADRWNGFFWKIFLKKVGKNFLVAHNVRFQSPYNITTGNDVFINFDTLIDGHAPVHIGNNVRIAYRVLITTVNHKFDSANDLKNNLLTCKPITISDNCWIAANAIILPGVTIQKNSIVGAGAVVTRTFPANSVIAGNPARVVKKRKPIK